MEINVPTAVGGRIFRRSGCPRAARERDLQPILNCGRGHHLLTLPITAINSPANCGLA